MVKGLDIFREFFSKYSENYLLIGGAACDRQFENAGLTFRATKDLDIVLIAEAYTAGFVKKFWEFIEAGKYEIREKSSGQKIFYRFRKPENDSYPWQLELFSRNPGLTLGDHAHLTPMPLEEDITSLSAILLNDEYYHFTLRHADVIDDVSIASTLALICLKASAWLDLKLRRENEDKIDRKDIVKHRNDIIRLAAILRDEVIDDLPGKLKNDLVEVITSFRKDPPDTALIGMEMGAGRLDLEAIIKQLEKTFRL